MVAPEGSGVGNSPRTVVGAFNDGASASSLFTTRTRPQCVHAVDWTTLQRIRHNLTANCVSSDATVTPEELEHSWLAVAEDKRRRQGLSPLGARDKEFIRVRVLQSTQELDPLGLCRVDLDMWAQHVLLTRASPALKKALRQVNWLLEAALHLCPGILVGLQHALEVAAPGPPTAAEEYSCRSGALSCGEVVGIFGHKLWHLRPGARGACKAERREFSYSNAEDFVRETVDAMEVGEDSGVTPGDFLSLCLGRREWEVTLHLYDLSRGAAAWLSPWLLNQKLEGVWHTGIVVYGREYYFGGELYTDMPGETGFGTPMFSVSLGYTLRHREELHAFVAQTLRPLFKRENYDAAFNNCNHFTDRVSMYLLGKHIPEEVLCQPELLLRSTLGRTLRPLLTLALGTCCTPHDGAQEIAGALAGALAGEKDSSAGKAWWWAKAGSKDREGDSGDSPVVVL
mmetsp:Transcript_124615/g.265828  ORF Transcript_124615/g.265828 Transcript_124615/m.265828 type:complete len:455 (+) Transcript_124615:113-1477(+)